MQGFGTTETTAVGTIMDQFDKATGRCGAPHFGAKIRLVDWEEGGYKRKTISLDYIGLID